VKPLWEEGYGIDRMSMKQYSPAGKEVKDLGVSIAIVVGGGNIYRGIRAESKVWTGRPVTTWGMIATVMNAVALQDCLETLGLDTRVQTAVQMAQVAEPYIRRRAIRHLEKGRTVIFAGARNPLLHH